MTKSFCVLLVAFAAILSSAPLFAQTTLHFNPGENWGDNIDTGSGNDLTASVVSGTASISSTIFGDGSVTKSGAGTLTLSGPNTYSGGTLITGGTLSVASAGKLGSGDITASGGGLAATSLEVTGVRTFTITGAGSTLTTGYLWFNRDNSADLQTFNVINGGTVTIDSTLSLADLNTASTGILNVSGIGSTVSAGGNIYIGYTGHSTATVADGGILSTGAVLSIATTGGSTGTFNLNAGGTLAVGGTGGIAIGAGTGLFNFNGGTLDVAGSNLTSSAAMILGAATTSTVDTNGFDATLSGVLSGTGALTKSGTGTLTLEGANSYTGATTVSGGTLFLAQGGASLADTTDVTITNGATLDLGSADETVRNVNLVSGTMTATGERWLSADAFHVQSGTLGVGLDGPAALTKTTAGTVTLTRAAQYDGATLINEGVFNVSGDAASIYTLVMNIGAAADATVNITDGAWGYAYYGLTLGDTAAGTGTLNITGPPAGALPAYTFTASDEIIIGYEGAGHVTLSGGGSLVTETDMLLAAGTGGSATVTVSGTDGESSPSAIGALGALLIAQGDNSNATLTVSAGGRAGFDGGVTVGAGAGSNGTLTITGTDSLLTGTAIDDPVTIALATGTGSTAQLNILAGAAVILADTESANALTAGPGTATVTLNNGTLGTTAGGTLTSSVAITTAGSNTLHTDTGAITLSGILSGTGAIEKSGTGTLTLGGANTYTGGTTVSAGTLTGNTTSLQGNITNNAAVTFDQASAGTYAGIMSGTGALTKSGTGTLTLGGANTFTGTTTISAGTLAFATRSAFYGDTVDATTAARLSTSTGATALFLVGDTGYFTSADIGTIMGNSWFHTGATLALDTSHATGGAFTLSANLIDTDSGDNVVSFLKSGAGTLTLTGDNTYTGNTTVSAGILSFTDTGTFYNGTIDATNAAKLNVASGATAAFTVGGASFSGADIGTILTSGAFAAGSTASLDTTSAGGSFTTTYAGAANLTKLGAGTLVLTGTNSGTGAITVSGGTLQIGDGLFTTSLAANAIASDSTVTFNPGPFGLTFAGVYSGTGGLTLSDMGTLTLSGANTFTGNTTIASGATLNLNHSLALQNSTYVTGGGTLNFSTPTATLGGLSGSGSLFLPNTSLTVGGNNAGTSYSGMIEGSGTFIKTGSGNLTFSGSFNQSGAGNLDAGTFTLGSSTALQNRAVTLGGGTLSFGTLTSATLSSLAGSGNLALANDSAAPVALTVGYGSGNTTYAGVISGTGSLTKIDHGTFTLSGANTYTGATTLSDGTLRLDPTGSLTGDLTLSSGTLELANTTGLQSATVNVNGGSVMFSAIDSATFGGLAGSGSFNLPMTSLTVGGNDANTTYFGTLYGNGAFTKTGSGNLTFSGSFNDSNAVSLNGGTFTLGAANALQSNAVTLNGGALGFGALTSATLGNLAGSGNLALANNADAAVALTVGNSSGDTTYSGILSGIGSLTKTGMSTFTLSGANTFIGNTTVSDGTLRLDPTGSLTGDLTLSSGTLELANTTGLQSATVNVNGGSVMFSAIDSAAFGGLAGSGSFTLPSTSLTVGGNNADTSYSGTISGNGTFTKTGSGNLTFSGSFNDYNAVSLNGGTFTLGSANTLQNNTVTLNGGALGFGALTSTTFGTLAGSGNLALANNTAAAVALTVGYSGNSSSYAGILSGDGSLTKTGAGTFTLSGANTFTGATTISDGTLKLDTTGSLVGALNINGGFLELANATGLQSSTVTLNGGSVMFSTIDSATFGGLAGSGSLNLPMTSLTVGGNNTDTSYSGSVYGPATFIKTGSGNFTFSGSFYEQNPVRLNGGTFTLGDTNALNNSAVTLNGGTLDLGTFSPTVGTVTFNGGTFTNGTLNNASAYEVQTGSLSSALGGTAALTKTGIGTFTLTGANTYSGGTTVSGGTLTGNATSLQGAITNNAAVTFDQASTGTYVGAISGTGALTKSGAGTLNLTGANTYEGGTTVSAGTLSGDTTSLQGNITNNAAVTFDQATTDTYGGVISGPGTLTKTGAGTLQFSASNTYTGATNINAGTLRLGESVTFASTAITIGSGASLYVDADSGFALGSTQTLGGTGSVTGGVLTLGSGATLAPGNSPGTLTFTSGLTLNAGAMLNFELGSAIDLIAVTGGTLTGPSSGTVTLNLSDAGDFTAGTYTLFDYTSATASDFEAADFTLGTTITGYDFSLGLLNSTLQLTAVSAVPEPSTYAAIAGLGACLAVVFKRRRMLGFVVWRKRRAAGRP